MKIIYQETCSKRHDIWPELKSVVLTIIGVFVLGRIYRFSSTGALFQNESVFLINVVIALSVLVYFASHRFPFPFWPTNIKVLSLPLTIIAMTLALSFWSTPDSPTFQQFSINLSQYWVMVFLVPIVEEIIFRLGLWEVLWSRSTLTKVYLTSMSFALLHYEGTAWPVGPFILGVISQVMLLRGGGLVGSILFHTACNATVVIFLTIDSRWLNWLKLFYLKS